MAADEEFLPFAAGSFDLVVASLSLHWINDLPGALLQLRQALRPEGLLLASLPALGTLAELRSALTEAEAEVSRRRVAPGVAVSRNCATARICCSGRVLCCRWRMWRISGWLMRTHSRCCATCGRRERPTRSGSGLGGCRTARLFPAALARLPMQEGRVTVTLRMAVMTGWAPEKA